MDLCQCVTYWDNLAFLIDLPYLTLPIDVLVRTHDPRYLKSCSFFSVWALLMIVMSPSFSSNSSGMLYDMNFVFWELISRPTALHSFSTDRRRSCTSLSRSDFSAMSSAMSSAKSRSVVVFGGICGLTVNLHSSSFFFCFHYCIIKHHG